MDVAAWLQDLGLERYVPAFRDNEGAKMGPKSGPVKEPAEQVVKAIRRATRRQFSAEEKIRIVLSGLRGEDSIAELCRREGIVQNPGAGAITNGYDGPKILSISDAEVLPKLTAEDLISIGVTLQRTGLAAQILDLIRGRRPCGVAGQALFTSLKELL
jgi:hypothetical protein